MRQIRKFYIQYLILASILRYIFSFSLGKFTKFSTYQGEKLMKTYIILFLFVASFVLAQTIQEQHDQYLIEQQNEQFLRCEPIVFTLTDCEGCSQENHPECSLKIDGNKYSLLIVYEDKKIYQEGAFLLGMRNQAIVATKCGDKAFKFRLEFGFELPKSVIAVEGDYQDLPPFVDSLLLHAGSHVYPIIKKNLKEPDYVVIIKSFVMAQRPLFMLFLKGPQLESDRFGCPNCSYSFYYYTHYCQKCGNCFSASSFTCNKCYSQSWTNGKSCSRCGQCYK